MESQLKVVRRNLLYWRLLVALTSAAGVLFTYAVVQENIGGLVRLLDIQSATTALLATVGALLARGQYSTAIRPMIGFQGRKRLGLAPGEREVVWATRMLNSGQDACTVESVRYSLRLGAVPPDELVQWLGFEEVKRQLVDAGLHLDRDCAVAWIGDGAPLAVGTAVVVGWFTERALDIVDAFGMQVEVRDRLGDVHACSINLLKGADRHPRLPATDW